jgi:hypothetical protein
MFALCVSTLKEIRTGACWEISLPIKSGSRQRQTPPPLAILSFERPKSHSICLSKTLLSKPPRHPLENFFCFLPVWPCFPTNSVPSRIASITRGCCCRASISCRNLPLSGPFFFSCCVGLDKRILSGLVKKRNLCYEIYNACGNWFSRLDHAMVTQ